MIAAEISENGEDEYEKPHLQKWSKAQNFAINIILEFLELKDVVKILTVVYTSQLKFVPSALLLNEILQKAVLYSCADIPIPFMESETSILLMIGVNKTLTTHTMLKLYNIIKDLIDSELVPCTAITVNDRECTFWEHGEEEEEEELSFKITFASSQCSDRRCDQIVLWHCCVCDSPCSECYKHGTTCAYCDEGACMGCLLTEDMCKKCGFVCVDCEDVIFQGDDEQMICQGSRFNQSCPYAIGPYCFGCVWPEGGPPKVSICNECDRMTCDNCNMVMYCEQVRGTFFMYYPLTSLCISFNSRSLFSLNSSSYLT
jgi:hypothetical protein